MISLIRANSAILQQGVDLLLKHSDSSYNQSDKAIYGSSIGGHVRHILDHYKAVIKSVDTGVVDYDNRVRNTDIETDRLAAIKAFEEMIDSLGKLESLPDCSVDVIVASSTKDNGMKTRSSLARELQFLVSHTVHHYALIAISSRVQGLVPAPGFGVAPSTLNYLKTTKA